MIGTGEEKEESLAELSSEERSQNGAGLEGRYGEGVVRHLVRVGCLTSKKKGKSEGRKERSARERNPGEGLRLTERARSIYAKGHGGTRKLVRRGEQGNLFELEGTERGGKSRCNFQDLVDFCV